MLFQICCDSVISVENASQCDTVASIELCSSLIEGGITPSIGLIKAVRAKTTKELNILIRPRGGDFLYSEDEIQIMLHDIDKIKDEGIDGIVIGALKEDGAPDFKVVQRLIDAIQGKDIKVTFHRAIDMTPDILEATRSIANYPGIHRILTSGGGQCVADCTDTLKQMVDICKDHRVLVMAAGGLDETNVQKIVELSGVEAVHGSLRETVDSNMQYRKEGVSMSSSGDGRQEFSCKIASKNRIEAVAQLLQKYT